MHAIMEQIALTCHASHHVVLHAKHAVSQPQWLTKLPVAPNMAVKRCAHTVIDVLGKSLQGVEASPTRSTAGTPCYRPGNVGVSRQLGLSAVAQQSPARSMRAPAAPASPASSMHSYKSTSELIESIQNRYLEAQSFLKSYKL